MDNIDVEKYERYISSMEDIKRPYIRKIVDNLMYFTTNELVEMVRRSVRKFIEQHTQYNLYVSDVSKGKISSEHFLLLRLRDEFNPVSIIKGNQPATNNLPILLIDDAIYSSCHMCATIDEYRYNTKCTNEFFVAVGVLSSYNVQLLKEKKYYKATVIADKVYTHLLPKTLFPELEFSSLYSYFGYESSDIIPIYFEHKIANEFGTYQFIIEFTNKEITRKVIDIITIHDVEEFILSKSK